MKEQDWDKLLKVKTGGRDDSHTKAECFEVPEVVTSCFFFNPFSVEVLRRVLARVIEAYYDNPREIRLFFYYPSDEYIAYLMQVAELEFEDEIDCSDIADGEKVRECIIIFRMNGLKL